MPTNYNKAIIDLVDGFYMWPIWLRMGNNDVRERYRRSVLGPIWIVVSTLVQILVTGFVLSFLFNLDLNKYLPYVAAGIIIWQFVVNTLTEGCMAFVGSGASILSVKRPFSYYIFLCLFRNLKIGSYSLIILILVSTLFKVKPNLIIMIFIPGLFLTILNAIWVVLLLSILSLRFRDVPQIVQNIFPLLFWLTPIVYEINQLPERFHFIIQLNPLTHIFSILRDPILMKFPPFESWLISFILLILGWSLTLIIFSKNRSKLSLWV